MSKVKEETGIGIMEGGICSNKMQGKEQRLNLLSH